MADAMDTLKNILGDDAEDKIKSVMDSISSPSSTAGGEGYSGAESLNQIMQMKNLMQNLTMNRNDPRTNLLLSLKPYMRGTRQHSIDSAVRLIGLTSVARLLRQ